MQGQGPQNLGVAAASAPSLSDPSVLRLAGDNVVPFLRAQNSNDSFHRVRFPVAMAESHRRMSWTFGALLIGSLALHGAVLAALIRDPQPMPSLGIPAISVEIVLGSDTPAGVAAIPTPGDAEAAVPNQKRAVEDTQEKPTDVAAHGTSARPVEPDQEPSRRVPQEPDLERHRITAQEPAAMAEPRDETRAPDPPARDVVLDPVRAPREAAPASEPTAEAVLESPPDPPMSSRREPETLAPQPVAPPQVDAAPAPLRPSTDEDARSVASAHPTPRPKTLAAAPKREAVGRPQPATAASSGAGRGSSSADPSYASRVAAHLARHKRFPPEARNQASSGSATVQFSIDGGGHVTSVRLVRGTGVAALDQEAQAMVRRASPVPPPPGRQAMSFTLPISFQVR